MVPRVGGFHGGEASMDWQIRARVAAVLSVSTDTLDRRIADGERGDPLGIPPSAVRRDQALAGVRGRVTLVDLDVARSVMTDPIGVLQARIAAQERHIADLRAERDRLLAERYQAAQPSVQQGEGVVLEGDAIVERHGLGARSGQRG
jgi:hypothetical protein